MVSWDNKHLTRLGDVSPAGPDAALRSDNIDAASWELPCEERDQVRIL